jgi:hypothetical protein
MLCVCFVSSQHDDVCGVCIARMRFLQANDKCAFCKVLAGFRWCVVCGLDLFPNPAALPFSLCLFWLYHRVGFSIHNARACVCMCVWIYVLVLQKKWDYVVFVVDKSRAKPWSGYNLEQLQYDKHYDAYFETPALAQYFKKCVWKMSCLFLLLW